MAVFPSFLLLVLLLVPSAAYGNITFCSSDACGGLPTTDADAGWVASQSSSSSSSYCGNGGFALLCLCPPTTSAASLAFGSDSIYRYTVNGDTLSFNFNCSGGLVGSQIPCLSATDACGNYNIFIRNSTRIDYDSAAMCAGTTGGGSVMSSGINAGLSAGAPVLISASDGVLVRGFQLGWSSALASAGCATCEGSGGVCRYNLTAAGSWLFSCFCSSDGYRSDHCGNGNGTTGPKNVTTGNGTTLPTNVTTGSGTNGANHVTTGISNSTWSNPTTGNDTNVGKTTKLGSGITRHKNIIIGVIAGPLALLLVLTFFVCLLCENCRDSILFLKKISEKERRIEAIIKTYEFVAPRKYKYAEVKKMTENFKVTLGKGGFGTVFKGKLSDGRQVAVKVLNMSKGEGEGFVNEVVSISKTSHVNVVTLMGFCLEGSNRALIYEFVPNGTLEEFINKDRYSLDTLVLWKTLHDIAVGIARGLEYLHRGCKTHIVHFDIKPHNILLDREFRPKIADFGLAKLCSTQKSALSVQGKRGTPGYMAPEFWFPNFGSISSKADVYSYGMMVLQMVKGKNNIGAGMENNSENCSVYQMYDHLIKYDNLEAYGVTVDTNEVAKKMILVGLWCIQKMPADRPTMSRVVEMLEGSTECLQIPPSPKLF